MTAVIWSCVFDLSSA